MGIRIEPKQKTQVRSRERGKGSFISLRRPSPPRVPPSVQAAMHDRRQPRPRFLHAFVPSPAASVVCGCPSVRCQNRRAASVARFGLSPCAAARCSHGYASRPLPVNES
ncbi:FAD-dependent oxidoreductase [Sesbania bispinosa]|nr:FAD-dependent oxidoreductase [Sesbania bispinosa]